MNNTNKKAARFISSDFNVRLARPNGFCPGAVRACRLAYARCRVGKNSPPDCFFTPCSNPAEVCSVNKKNSKPLRSAVQWRAERDSNPRPSA